jgi:hypothetical protein
MQTGTPVELRLLLAVHGDGALERELQMQFARFALRGEWFRPARSLLRFIEELRRLVAPGANPIDGGDPPPEVTWEYNRAVDARPKARTA